MPAYSDKCQAVTNTVMNQSVPLKTWNFLHQLDNYEHRYYRF